VPLQLVPIITPLTADAWISPSIAFIAANTRPQLEKTTAGTLTIAILVKEGEGLLEFGNLLFG